MFYLDEGAYQVSAVHRLEHRTWRVEDTHYFGWTNRGYQMWLYAFIALFGAGTFGLRLASAAAGTLTILFLLLGIRRLRDPVLTLAFGLLLALCFPLIFWSRLAGPYPVCMMPVALGFWILMERDGWASGAACGVCAALAVTMKESAILFWPAFGLTLVAKKILHKKDWSETAAYAAAGTGLIVAFAKVFITPTSHAWWNGTAENSNEGVKAFTHPSLAWFKQVYVNVFHLPGAANFLGLGMLSGLGVWAAGRERVDLDLLPSVFFGLWFLGAVTFLAIGNSGVSSAIMITQHYSILLLPALCWFAALAVAHAFRGRWSARELALGAFAAAVPLVLIPALRHWRIHHVAFDRALALSWPGHKKAVMTGLLMILGAGALKRKAAWAPAALLLGGVLLPDLWKTASWLARPAKAPSPLAAARATQDAVLADWKGVGRPVVLSIDFHYLLGRAPKLDTLTLRSFHLRYLRRLDARWRIDYLVVHRRPGAPDYARKILAGVSADGFRMRKIGEAGLGFFDGFENDAEIYALAKN